MEKIVNLSELALRSGRSLQFLSNLVKKGILPEGEKGWQDGRERLVPLQQCLEILKKIPRRSRRRTKVQQEAWDKVL